MPSLGPREQMNARTAYIDGSQIYGSDQEMMNSLRTFEAGLLKSQVSARYNVLDGQSFL